MAPPDVYADRAVSVRPMRTRWKPVDLVCRRGETEMTVRTKLARDAESTAVCVAEAVSHALLLTHGFRMAEPFCVVVGREFARDLTAHYGFKKPVRPGRHWGTRLMRRGVQEVEFSADLVGRLADPPGLFRLYLADVILGNPDRETHGNVLLAKSDSDRRRFDLIPIDQSDAFLHPSAMIQPQRFRARFDEPKGQMLDGTESVLLDRGPTLVEACFARAKGLRDRAGRFVGACHDEWLNRAGADPSVLEQFIEHRVDTLEILARKDHWLDLASINSGGKRVLDID